MLCILCVLLLLSLHLSSGFVANRRNAFSPGRTVTLPCSFSRKLTISSCLANSFSATPAVDSTSVSACPTNDKTGSSFVERLKPLLLLSSAFLAKPLPSLAASSAAPKVGAASLVVHEVVSSLEKLVASFAGLKADSLLALIATTTIIPLFKVLRVSPIVGFLLMGTLIGPGGFNLVHDVHLVDAMGEIGIVFFLFEMGLELSMEKLKSMRKLVFGLGSSQFLLTSAVVALGCRLFQMSWPSAIAVGGSLALSSSAFVLQLLKDKNALDSDHGKASFGILLLQDLAVVPLLVVVELLGGGGAGIGRALGIAGIKALATLAILGTIGKALLTPLFSVVEASGSKEAFLSTILATMFSMSFITQGIGLSDTLGAFLAGILLSETRFNHRIEKEISVFRGFLLGLFFMTVGFKLDAAFVVQEAKTIIAMLVAMVGTKAAVIAVLGKLFGLSWGSSQLCGLLNAQAGEFAFVSLGIAERLGLLPKRLTKLLLTTVAVSMAVTPLLAEIGSAIANRISPHGDPANIDSST